MKPYSYVVTFDAGFAPNPFFGYCTLACCKPGIRRTARKRDWVAGLAPKAEGNGIVFYMHVDEDPIGFDAFWNDARFGLKRPRYDAGIIRKYGDNIYEPRPNGGYRQLTSMHSDGDRENPRHKKHDLLGLHVLISQSFAYFGSDALELPSKPSPLIVQRGYRCRFSDGVKAEFLRFAETRGFGLRANPRQWPPDEASRVYDCGRCRGSQK